MYTLARFVGTIFYLCVFFLISSGSPSPDRKRHCLSPPCPDCVARYASYLKEKYRRLSVFHKGSEWPPPVGNFDIQVALIEHQQYPQNSCVAAADMCDIVMGGVDRILARKKAITIEEILAPSDTTGNELKILIDGAPGVGKTTLTRRFVKDWAEGKLLSMNDLVLLLPLREKRIAQAKEISDLFYHDDAELREQIVKHVCTTMGANIMLILDGFDELSLSQRKEGSLILNIIHGETLMHCSVIVTSRPVASEMIRRLHCLTRHVEVLGFTEQQIQHCITSSYLDAKQAQTLVLLLQERQDLISLCYIPLNCAIMIFMYKYQSYTLPDTITQLYEMFLANVLKRHADKYDEDLGKRVRNLDRLPDSLQACLTALSKLAFTSLENDQSTFYVEEIEAELSDIASIASEGDLPSKLLGIVNVFQSTSGAGIEESYQFLHRTIQEFLAARYVSGLPANDQVAFFKKQIETSSIVAVFQAGLSKLSDPEYQQYFENEVSFNLVVNEQCNESADFYSEDECCDKEVFLQYLYALYETQNLKLCKVLPKCVESQEISIRYVRLSPFHCRVLAYCLINSGCCWKRLDLSRCELSDVCLQAFRSVHAPTTDCTSWGSVKELIFSNDPVTSHIYANTDNVFTFAGLSLIPSVPLFQRVEVLKLKASCLIPKNGLADGFMKLLQMENLASLSFNPDYFMSQYMKYTNVERELVPCKLLEHPIDISPSLKTLKLAISKTSDCTTMENIANSLKKSDINNLELCAQYYSIVPDGVSVMLPSFLSMRAIQTLSLTLGRHYTADIQVHPITELEGLQRMLETSETLKHLELSIDCMIEADVQYLAKGLSVNKALTSLSVHSGSEGILTFADFGPVYKALHKKVKLEKLHLGAHYSSNSTDKTAESGLYALHEALKLNISLHDLMLSGVGDSEVKCISDGLMNHSSLNQVILLGNTTVQTSSIVGLLRALLSCSVLQVLDLHIGLTAFGSWVQDHSDAAGGHWDIQRDNGCSDVGKLIGTLLQRLLVLRLNFFSSLHYPDESLPFPIPPDWLPNTRLIIEGLCNNLSARYPFLRNCGLPQLDFLGYLFAFEAVAGNVDDPDQSLLPMQWESVERTVAGYRHLQFQTTYIGVRISVGNSNVDLLLEVVEAKASTQLNPGEYFAKTHPD